MSLTSVSSICSGCTVHTGFNTAWNELSSDTLAAVASAVATYPSYRVVATGYSLGAAVATIATAVIRNTGQEIDLYTYGSPRVGNSNFVSHVVSDSSLGEHIRVTHLNDPVPKLPLMLWGYRHVTPEYWLSTGSSSTIDYSFSDIEVCEGTASISCNGGTLTFDVDAHYYYLTDMSGCETGNLEWKRQNEDMTDEELEEMLDSYAQQDYDYAIELAGSGGD